MDDELQGLSAECVWGSWWGEEGRGRGEEGEGGEGRRINGGSSCPLGYLGSRTERL